MQKDRNLKATFLYDVVTKWVCFQGNPSFIIVNKCYNKPLFQLKVLDIASHQSNSKDNETTQNPTEHQTSSTLQTSSKKFATL